MDVIAGIVSVNAWVEWCVGGGGEAYSVENQAAVWRWRLNSVFNA